MKTYILSFAFALCTLGLFSQSQITTVDVNIGDTYKIGTAQTATYKHIDIPKPNIIRKRGGLPNHRDIQGSIVEVTDIKEKKNGTTEVVIKLKDGRRFFGSHRWIKADFKGALEAGELLAH